MKNVEDKMNNEWGGMRPTDQPEGLPALHMFSPIDSAARFFSPQCHVLPSRFDDEEQVESVSRRTLHLRKSD